ncbi:MAG: L-threonylcarbamoyladenylate synthase [Coriobacteriales bacterium]
MTGDKGLRALQQGACLLISTDTVYGLAALPGSEGYERIFSLKKRPASQTLPWLVEGTLALDELARDLPAYARRLADMFWPGGLTLVVKASGTARARGGVADDGTVALRMPDDPRCRQLMRALDSPLACTSANLHGCPAPVLAEQIDPSLRPFLDPLAAPACPGGLASTIVDCTTPLPRILREGAVPAQAVLAVALLDAPTL